MTHDIDHSRCSELLGAHLDRRLDPRDEAAVAAHLETCDECSAELAGLEALRKPVEGLNPGERDRLRRTVARATGAAPGRVVALPEMPPPPRWASRASGLVGAAAAVALLVAGSVVVGRGMLGGTDAGDRGGGAGSERTVPVADGPRPVFDAAAGPAMAAQGADEADAAAEAEESANGGGEAAAAGRAAPGGRITRADLQRLGARGEPFRSFAKAYSAPVDPRLQRAFAEDLASAAPDHLQTQVRKCTAEMTANNERILPSYGAERRYQNEPVLVLGFVTATSTSGPVDGFLFVLWPTDSCTIPSTSVGGQIRG